MLQLIIVLKKGLYRLYAGMSALIALLLLDIISAVVLTDNAMLNSDVKTKFFQNRLSIC